MDFVTCGTGAADIDTSEAPSLKEALESRGLKVNPTLWDFYESGAGSTYIRTPGKLANQTSGGSRDSYTINEVPLSVYTEDVTASLAQYNDAAIVTISRVAGEGADLAIDGFTDGTNILELTTAEQDLLKMANQNFEKVIVLINSTNAIECDLNDNETMCRCISTWANEQAIREIYLEPFEMAVVDGGAYSVMNAFARVGVVWSGAHEGLMTNILRDEWGMKGFALTDFSGNSMFAQYGIMMKSFDVAWGLLAGTDSWDSSAVQWTDDLNNLYKNDPDVCQAMREATHRILYTVANSNAMNGISSTQEIVAVTPWWETALYVLIGTTGILSVFSVVMAVREIKKNKVK